MECWSDGLTNNDIKNKFDFSNTPVLQSTITPIALLLPIFVIVKTIGTMRKM